MGFDSLRFDQVLEAMMRLVGLSGRWWVFLDDGGIIVLCTALPQKKNKIMTMEQKIDALIWVICVSQNELKMSQIDSSRDLGYFSILIRQKQQVIEYFTTKLS